MQISRTTNSVDLWPERQTNQLTEVAIFPSTKFAILGLLSEGEANRLTEAAIFASTIFAIFGQKLANSSQCATSRDSFD